MATNVLALSRKLVNAINAKYGSRLVICSNYFFRSGKEVHMKILKDSYYDEEGVYAGHELFSTASSIYMCLFLKDLLDEMGGSERADTNNPGYDAIFSRKDGQKSIDYMKEKYVTHRDFDGEAEE